MSSHEIGNVLRNERLASLENIVWADSELAPLVTYTVADTFGRYQRMAGKDVFQPMGFDAFGIHGENYALKLGENPAVVMPRNITRFREEQIKRMGGAFDWSLEVDTTDARYYPRSTDSTDG